MAAISPLSQTSIGRYVRQCWLSWIDGSHPNRVTRLVKFSHIGRLVSLRSLQNYWSSPNVWPTFFQGKISVLILTKSGLGCIFATFLQTHLVTLYPFDLTCTTSPVYTGPSSLMKSKFKPMCE
jgi:hypothetical protein